MNNQVNIFNEHNFSLEKFPDLALAIFDQTLKVTEQKKADYEIAVIFIDENLSLHLNKTYRKKNYVADVLSFNNKNENDFLNQESEDLGDIYICYPKAKKQANDYEHSLTRELSFLFLHGLLHNLGYDHEIKEDEKIMFDLQKTILNALHIFRN